MVRSFWAGIGAIAFGFCLTMGSLNAWQLAERGVPVSGARLGEVPVMVTKCSRDPLTLWQGWTCEGRLLDRSPNRSVTMRAAEPVSGDILAEAWAGRGGGVRGMIVLPPGTQATPARLMPTDVALVVWLVVVAALPMALAIRGSWRRAQVQRNPFDAMAAGWDDDPAHQDRAAKVAAAIRERTPPGGRWMDYGAGTGLLGLALLDHADRVVLVDSSKGMVARAEAKIAKAGLDARATAVDVDLAAEDGSGLGEMDGIVSLLALHHVEDVPTVLGRLVALLRPGGWLAIADLDAEDGSYHARHGHHVAHNGFDRDQVRAWFGQAGLIEPEFSTPVTMNRDGREYPIFLAVARRG